MTTADPVDTPVGKEPSDLLDVLVADHRRIDALLRALESPAPGSPARRRDVVDVLVAELVRHAAAEEQVLYPALRRYLSEGARDILAGHARIEAVLADLMGTFVEDTLRFDALVARLAAEGRQPQRPQED